VLLAAFILGLWIEALQGRFESSINTFDSFVIQFYGTWSGFLIVGSVDGFAQAMFYFGVPLLATRIVSRRSTGSLSHSFPRLMSGSHTGSSGSPGAIA
jgi:hypothetical protein